MNSIKCSDRKINERSNIYFIKQKKYEFLLNKKASILIDRAWNSRKDEKNISEKESKT